MPNKLNSINWYFKAGIGVIVIGAITVAWVGCKTCKQLPLAGKVEREPKVELPEPWQALMRAPGETKINFTAYKTPNERKDGQRKDVTVVVAISGGGLRAANFAVGVLKALESWKGPSMTNLLHEVDFFSTVSGGGLAAGALISSRVDHVKSKGRIANYSFVRSLEADGKRLLSMLENDYEHRLLLGLVDPRSIGQVDRGDFLEMALDQKILGSKARGASMTFGDVFVMTGSEKPVLHPYIFANATVVGTATHFVFAPDVLTNLLVRSWTHNLRRSSAVDECLLDFPLAVGLKASASFPGAIPATTIEVGDSNLFLHLMDGGVSDNLGLRTALQVLAAQPKGARNLLIIIDAFNSSALPLTKKEGSPMWLKQILNAADLPLDASHARMTELIESARRGGSEFQHVVIDFGLLENSGLLESELLGQEARKIGTRFNVSPNCQKILIAAGEAAVEAADETLKKAVELVFGAN